MLLETKTHTLIEKKGKEFADYLSGDDKEAVMVIVRKSRKQLDDLGNKKHVVYNPTKKEISNFTTSVQGIIRFRFTNKIKERDGEWFYHPCARDFWSAVHKTNFPDELVGNWILLRRKMKKNNESKNLHCALVEFIKDEIIQVFTMQNQKLLKKYNI